MLYKLYRSKHKSSDPVYDDSFSEFNKLYKKYDVKVVGGGTNIENPQEEYFMTVYKNKAHYEETVSKLRNDPKYQELTKKLEDRRDSIEVITLESEYEL